MKYLLLIITLLSTIQVNSQVFPAKFRIRFADKNRSPYSLNAPSKFLTEKAIERRKKQQIALSENDIPVNPFYLDSLKKAGAVILNYSKWFNSALILVHDSSSFVHIRSFSFISGIDTLVKNFEGLKKSPIVHVQKEKLFYEHSNSFTTGKNYFDIKNENMTNELKNQYGASFEQIQLLGGIRLHQANHKGDNMIIAVLDAGFLNVDKLHAFDSLWLTKRIL